MCGIAGYTGEHIAGVLTRMSNAMAYRGPDAANFFNTKGLHLMHRRLQVIDLESGAQPMSTADNQLTVIFNGEIYNHRELRKLLEDKGHSFCSDHSDTEVLLHGYRQWGEELPEKLNGMWSFCIFNSEEETLFISRDRFGQKPLYYTQTATAFIFASELGGIEAHPLCSREISELSLQKFFAYGFIPHPRTIYKNVRKLPGGHNLSYNLQTKRLTIKRYWHYEIEPDYSLLQRKEELQEELITLLDRATARRMDSDVPLGVLLSGGIDSSAVAALASRHTENLATFSIGFDADSYDESAYSDRVAELLNSRHHPTRLTLEHTRDYLPEILSRLDEPQGDDSLLPTYLVCKNAREHVTVALGGDGGDELFSGYEPFKFWRWARRYNIYLPQALHRAVNSLTGRIQASHRYMALSLKIKRFFYASGLSMPVWIPALMAPLQLQDISELFDKPLALEDIYSEAISCWNNCRSRWVGDRITQYYVDYYLQDEILAKTDRASMLNSLELRSPFLDIELADFARRLPHQLKLHAGTTKYILKKSLEKILPHDILYRPKQGFSPPAGDWFASGALNLRDRVCPAEKPAKIAQLLEEHKSYKHDNRLFLWNQLTLGYFMDRTTDD